MACLEAPPCSDLPPVIGLPLRQASTFGDGWVFMWRVAFVLTVKLFVIF
ncbi:hypothetical protein AALP_AA8G286500 [Arabis alpina]|uniref:Uncharacterized protein n=1 Tax=Arabis alpina TaxID=50452 RepID=A0A087GA37_ARAAL|nr:hypothetical protein AALP_AA8G286500 [Arabis alpina]